MTAPITNKFMLQIELQGMPVIPEEDGHGSSGESIVRYIGTDDGNSSPAAVPVQSRAKPGSPVGAGDDVPSNRNAEQHKENGNEDNLKQDMKIH